MKFIARIIGIGYNLLAISHKSLAKNNKAAFYFDLAYGLQPTAIS